MATNINLVTYSGSMVSPLDDAIVYETAIAESGIIYGGNLTIKNVNTIHINAGHGIVCGRKFTITDSDISVQLTSGAQELGRIYLHLDLANTTEPIQILTEIGATLTPVIQQTDVNINNGIYEINLATFNIDSMTIADLVEVFPTVSNPIGYLSDLDTTNKNSIVDAINEVNSKEVSVLDTGEEIMANTTPGKAAGANGVKELITEVNDSLRNVDVLASGITTPDGTIVTANYKDYKFLYVTMGASNVAYGHSLIPTAIINNPTQIFFTNVYDSSNPICSLYNFSETQFAVRVTVTSYPTSVFGIK